MFQELGLIDDGVNVEVLARRQKLGPGVQPPWEFEDANAWSRHLRSRIGQTDASSGS